MGLIDDVGNGPVALDRAAFIYFIKVHPLYLPALAVRATPEGERQDGGDASPMLR